MGGRALEADAAEVWVCSYLSLALLAGVGLHELFGWWWADPVGALAMLPVILWQGWKPSASPRTRGRRGRVKRRPGSWVAIALLAALVLACCGTTRRPHRLPRWLTIRG
jgi:hypothetical protein